ncbi:MAG: MerR family DNA-binding transcriptional regulator, partial [Candidatus Levybacteria bacterium]|nr:MerR family DNA-binding transcriptional regulator [Candidatus Levybacteria bacterium]
MDPALEEKELLTIGEAAKKLNVSIDTLRRWDKKGALLPIRTEGGQRRYDSSQLEKFTEVREEVPHYFLQSHRKLIFTLVTLSVFSVIFSTLLLFIRSQPVGIQVLGTETKDIPLSVIVGNLFSLVGKSTEKSPIIFYKKAKKLALANKVSLEGEKAQFTTGRFIDSLSVGEASTTLSDGELSSSVKPLTIEASEKINFFSESNFLTSEGALSLVGGIIAESFSGNGSKLTNIDAENITKGILDSTYLPSDVSYLGKEIESSEIKDGTILATDLADGSITTTQIKDSTIENGDLRTGSFSNITAVGNLTSLTVSGGISVGEDATVSGRARFTKVPSLPHTGTWAIDSVNWNVSDATVYINPSTATADSNLFGVAVAGGVKFAIDAEGDIYGRNLILAGSTTQGT